MITNEGDVAAKLRTVVAAECAALGLPVPRLAVEPGTVPVVHTIGGVGVLLNLKNDRARAERVEAAARDENRIARARWDFVEARLKFCFA